MTGVKILLVEDDPIISMMVRDALSEGGFEHVGTGAGEEALYLLDLADADFRAIVTDINLSGEVNGWRVAQHARERVATIAVVYMTGTHSEEWASKGVPNSVILSKPFAPAQLVTALATLLNAGAAPQQSE